MTTQDEKKRLMTKAVKKNDYREVSAEYTLPDYLPDVNRLLKVSATAAQPEKYFSADTAEYDGSVAFSIVYASAEGKIRCAEFNADYTGNISVPEADDFSVTDLCVKTENPTCRLQSPRKLTAKCKLCATISVTASVCADPVVTGKMTAEAESSLQYRKKIVEFVREIKAEEISTPVSEDIEIDPGMPYVSEVIFAELSPSVFEVRTASGKLSYSGDLLAHILYESENGEYVSFTRKVPLSGAVDADGVTEESVAFCKAEVSNVTFRPQTNELGESKTVELDFDYSIYFSVFRKDTCALTDDAYSLTHENSAEKQTWKYLSLDTFKCFNFSANESEELAEDEIDRAVCVSAAASISSAEKSGSKTTLCGTVSFHAILAGKDGTFSGRTFSFPFKAETDTGKYSELFSYRATASVGEASARIAGGKIYFDSEISICLVIFGENETDALTEVAVFIDRPVEKLPKNSIILYYPTKGEDLWCVAKKYHVTKENLASVNTLTKENLDGGVLIIPTEKITVPAKK